MALSKGRKQTWRWIGMIGWHNHLAAQKRLLSRLSGGPPGFLAASQAFDGHSDSVTVAALAQ
eukprot:752939-Hanusia_phi.AAC.2